MSRREELVIFVLASELFVLSASYRLISSWMCKAGCVVTWRLF